MELSGAGVVVSVDAKGLRQQIHGMQEGLERLAKVGDIVTKYANKIQAQAVLNVSGMEVTYSGGTFIINRQTGKLTGGIQVVSVNRYSAVIKAVAKKVRGSANYADFVESGHRAIDLKPYLIGKTVPIKLKGNNGNRYIPYPVQTGLVNFNKDTGTHDGIGGNSHQGNVKVTRRKQYASTGRLMTHENVIFRKVTRHSKGWIVPPMPPRPFMQAAAEKYEAAFVREITEAFNG